MATSSIAALRLLLVFFLFSNYEVAGEDQARNNVILLSGTRDLDQWTDVISNGLSLVSSGLIAAVLVTGALYLVGSGQTSRRTDRRTDSWTGGAGQGYYRYPDRREDGIFQHMERIISYLSLESLQDVVSNIKHEILGSLSSVRDDELQRVDDDTGTISNEITDTLDVLGGGSKVEDCLLQALCYLTPDEVESEAGESRKNKEKQKRKEEKKKEKKKKKAKKNKNKNKDDDYFEDYEDEEIEDDFEKEENNEEESDLDIEEEDCDVFQCDMVRYGYQVFQLYDKVQTLRQQFDSLTEK